MNISLLLFLIITINTQNCLQQHQYQSDLGECHPCYHKCLTCIDSSNICDSCNSEYYLNTITHHCQSCSKGCSICQNVTICESCNDNFYLNANATCTPCTIGVDSCTISTISQCLSGYYLLNSICAKCIDNCQTCNNSVTCKVCSNGFYLNANLQCLDCGINCAQCSSSSSCSSCNTGFQPVPLKNECDVCNGTGNSIYSQATETCIICPNYCLKCDFSICYYCEQGYMLSNDQISCIQGGSILCYQSKGQGYTQCQVDINGCPPNTNQQYDTSTGFLIPTSVCLPKSFTSTSQFIYDNFQCSVNLTKTYSFTSQPKYESTIEIQLFIIIPLPNSITIHYGSNSQQLSIPTNISSQPVVFSSCGNHKIWNTAITFTGSAQIVWIETNNIFISQIYIEGKLCSVLHCASCTTNLDCTSCLSPYYIQLNQCVPQCQTGFYTYQTNTTCFITCPDKTFPISSQYQCKDCDQNNCNLCSSIDVCLSCKSGFYLFNYSCISNCKVASASTYYGDNENNICRLCPFPCKTCEVINNVTFCYSCNTGYLFNSQCVFICPNGTYPSFNTILICQTCSSSAPYFCDTCSINSTTCRSCINTYYLLDSACVLNCPNGYYSNNGQCLSCQSPCLTCNGNSTNCLSCSTGNYYFNSLTLDGQCLLYCPGNTYNNYTNTSNPICSNCQTQCSKCYGPSSNECLSCNSNYYLYGSSCLSTCSDNTTYQNTLNNTCSICKPPCKTCQSTNGSACTSCTIGFLSQQLCTLVCNETSYTLLISSIYTCTACPSNCYSCTSFTKCKSCVSPFLLLNNECIDPSNCNNGYYQDTLNLKCNKCSSPCSTCLNSLQCITCVSNYYLYRSFCVSTCPNGTILLSSKCQACDPNCQTCSSFLSNCTSCFSYNNQLTYLYDNTCLTQCPNQYYSDSSTSSCRECVAPCLTCYNLYLCSSCVDNSQFLYDNQCLDTCPSDTLPTNKICQLCTDQCLSCTGSTNNCTLCSQLYFYYYNVTDSTGYCMQSCPNLYYDDSFSGLCIECVTPCQTCTSQIMCLSCLSTFSLYIESCLGECPSSYYSENRICVSCVSPCQQCQSQTNCTLCTGGFYMPYGETWTENCLTNCPLGQYQDNFNQACSLCDANCLNCSSLTVCHNCTGSYYLYLNACQAECPLQHYPQNNQCLQCATKCLKCITASYCTACLGNFSLYENACFDTCPASTFQSISIYQNINVCYNCSPNCLECGDYYECNLCKNGFFIENGQCVSSCSLFYYSDVSKCLSCGFSCSSCINSTYCLNCSNTYIWQNTCFSVCPKGTYSNYTALTCIQCVAPCLTCINEYSCISCMDGYKFYESICVTSCPNNTWLYNNQCISQCDKFKDYSTYICYDSCPIFKVAQNNICLDQCPVQTYVSRNRICTTCNEQCKYLFKGDLQLVAVNGFRLVLYFNQRAQQIAQDLVFVSIESMNISKRLLMSLTSSDLKISDRSIQIQYQMQSSQMIEVVLQIPYIKSKDTQQAISSNKFVLSIYNYHKPEPKFNFKIIGYIVSIAILILFVVNILYGVGHYQAVLQLAQIFSMLNYLQIYYPWPLYQFYEGLQLIMFAPVFNIYSPYIYSFSPSKFINYNVDIEFMRNSLSVILVLYLPLALIISAVFILTYLKREVTDGQASRFLKICRVIQRRLRWRYLNDYFFIGIVWIGVFGAATYRNSPNSYTIITYIFGTICLIGTIIAIAFVFYVVLRTVKKRKRDLQQIQGLVEDLQVDTSTLGLMYTPILYLRKLLLMFLIGLYSTYPISSLFMLMVLSALLFVILFFYKPFKNSVTDHVVVALEVCLILTIFLLVILKMNEDILSDTARFGISLTVTIIDILALLTAVGWWGYLTITDYVIKSGFSFGQNFKSNLNQISDNTLQQHESNDKKFDISNVLNDVTNTKANKLNKGHKLSGSQIGFADRQQDSSYNIHQINDSESGQSDSSNSKDIFKHYKSQEGDSDKDIAHTRLKKEPIIQFEEQAEF